MKRKSVLVLLIVFIMMSVPFCSYAANFDLNVNFDGRLTITMESATPGMNWDIDCLLPGQTDTSVLNVRNVGNETVDLQTSISIEENDGLLDMVDVVVKDSSQTELYSGAYTDFTPIIATLDPGQTETYTVVTSMNVNAGNEYQGKQYKLKFDFAASGEIKTGTLIVRYVDENGEDISTSEIKSGLVSERYERLPSVGKSIDGYEFVSVEGNLEDYYQPAGSTVTYKYNRIKYGNLSVKWVSDNEGGKVLKSFSDTQRVGTKYKYSAEKFDGYEFKNRIDGNPEGTYTEDGVNIVFHYDKTVDKDRGNVIILYVDENENEIGRKLDSDEVGNEYSYTDDEIIREIPGYKFIRIDGEKSGRFKKEDTVIYCRYESIKRGNVIILCVDENDQIIRRTVLTEIVDTDYDLGDVGEEISGYTFLGVEGPTRGKYRIEDTIVKYRYKKNVPVVTVVTEPKTGDNVIIFVDIVIIVLEALIVILIIKRKNEQE